MRYIVLIVVLVAAAGCKRCKECFFIEEVNGNKNEIALGEFCGKDIAETEAKEYTCFTGKCYNECR